MRVRDDGIGVDPEVLARGQRPGHWGLPGTKIYDTQNTLIETDGTSYFCGAKMTLLDGLAWPPSSEHRKLTRGLTTERVSR